MTSPDATQLLNSQPGEMIDIPEAAIAGVAKDMVVFVTSIMKSRVLYVDENDPIVRTPMGAAHCKTHGFQCSKIPTRQVIGQLVQPNEMEYWVPEILEEKLMTILQQNFKPGFWVSVVVVRGDVVAKESWKVVGLKVFDTSVTDMYD